MTWAELMNFSILAAQAQARLDKSKKVQRSPRICKREAWADLKIWRGATGWVHSMSGRVFIYGTPKANWCEEMDELYGVQD